MTAYWAVWREAEFDRGIAFYDDHPDFTIAYDAATWNSLADAEAAFRPLFDTVESQDIEIDEIHIVALAREWAYVTERGTFLVNFRDGSTSPRRAFAATHLWVKTEDRWKVRSFHESTRELD
jgi:hypothetical protein